MSDILNISDFLDPVRLAQLSDDEGYQDGQFGKHIAVYDEELPALEEADIVLVGCAEERGQRIMPAGVPAPDAIRRELYALFYWHRDIRVADAGNIRIGATLNDTHAALKTVVKELINAGKTVLVLGGSHDLTLAQYQAFADNGKVIEATCVDALMDIDILARQRSSSFMMEMLTSEPNFIAHYNHIGFQSFYVHPHMLEIIDKLRFDCYRVGTVKQSIEEMEPVIRNSSLFSFDISAIANAFAPASTVSPNGLTGEEACLLMRYAGLSPHVSAAGIYGYLADKDMAGLTAKQISHMIWYFIDGRSKGRREARLEDKDAFNEFHIAFAEIETTFLQSKKTGRWWMQLPDKKFIACSYTDYLHARSNEIPERWLRAQERG